MEAELNKVFELVSQPDNQTIKQGEQLLEQLKKNSQYPLALLAYIHNPNIHDVGKLRATI